MGDRFRPEWVIGFTGMRKLVGDKGGLFAGGGESLRGTGSVFAGKAGHGLENP